jgi:hypothetical protein
MPHQKFPQLLPLRELKINRLINFPRRKIHRPHQIIRTGRNIQILRFPIHWQRMKLPSLPPIQQPQTTFIHLLLVQIDEPNRANILFHPRVLDRPRIDAKQPLRQIPKWPPRLLLHFQNMIHLRGRKNALLNQQLTNRNTLHSSLLRQSMQLISNPYLDSYRSEPAPGLAILAQNSPNNLGPRLKFPRLAAALVRRFLHIPHQNSLIQPPPCATLPPTRQGGRDCPAEH